MQNLFAWLCFALCPLGDTSKLLFARPAERDASWRPASATNQPKPEPEPEPEFEPKSVDKPARSRPHARPTARAKLERGLSLQDGRKRAPDDATARRLSRGEWLRPCLRANYHAISALINTRPTQTTPRRFECAQVCAQSGPAANRVRQARASPARLLPSENPNQNQKPNSSRSWSIERAASNWPSRR